MDITVLRGAAGEEGSVRLIAHRPGRRPAAEEVRLTRLGDKAPKAKEAPPTVTAPEEPAALVPMRVVVPWQYRRIYADSDDSPTKIFADLVAAAGLGKNDSTRGRWSKVEVRGIEEVVSVIRVTPEAADKLRKASGYKGIFFTSLGGKEKRAPVAWHARAADESDEDYFRRCRGLTTALVFRAGGGADLGVVSTEAGATSVGEYCMYGAPGRWREEQVTQFLAGQGWKLAGAALRDRATGRGDQRWRFRAAPPAAQQGRSCV